MTRCDLALIGQGFVSVREKWLMGFVMHDVVPRFAAARLNMGQLQERCCCFGPSLAQDRLCSHRINHRPKSLEIFDGEYSEAALAEMKLVVQLQPKLPKLAALGRKGC